MTEFSNWFPLIDVNTVSSYYDEVLSFDNPMVCVNITPNVKVFLEEICERGEYVYHRHLDYKEYMKNSLIFMNMMGFVQNKITGNPTPELLLLKNKDDWKTTTKYPTAGTYLLANLMIGIDEILREERKHRVVTAKCYLCPHVEGKSRIFGEHSLDHVFTADETINACLGLQGLFSRPQNLISNEHTNNMFEQYKTLRQKVICYVDENFAELLEEDRRNSETPLAMSEEGKSRVL